MYLCAPRWVSAAPCERYRRDMPSKALPPGQRGGFGFPAFGLAWFAKRVPRSVQPVSLRLAGDGASTVQLDREALGKLPRVEQMSDLHCVTSWSACGLRWGGVLFRDLFSQVIEPRVQPEPAATTVLLRAADGYEATIPLEDLLADDVLIADSLDGGPLTLPHGAPLRLVAPAHYAYKSVKYLTEIGVWRDDRHYRPPGPRWMAHPRGRVALEERSERLPGWLARYMYRPFLPYTRRLFASRFRTE